MIDLKSMIKEIIFNARFTGPDGPFATLVFKTGGQGQKVEQVRMNILELSKEGAISNYGHKSSVPVLWYRRLNTS